MDTAIALTGTVHFINNLFKIVLVWKNVDRKMILKFGIPAVLSSLFGAWLLISISEVPSVYQYNLWQHHYKITLIKFVIAVLLIVFSVFEILPAVKKIQFKQDKLFIGGMITGFIGGLSGLQGAIRSAFLINSGLSKESFIATGVMIACMVDFTRLSVYASRFASFNLSQNQTILIFASGAAIAGAYLGKRLLKSITLKSIRLLVSIMLIIISIALGLGII